RRARARRRRAVTDRPAVPRPGATPGAALRDVELRTSAANGAHGVYGDGVRRSVHACLRLLLPPGAAARRRSASGVTFFCAADPLREPDPLHRRRMVLSTAWASVARRCSPHGGRAVWQPQPLPRVRAGGAARAPAGRVTNAVLLAVLQAVVVGLGAPLLVGTLRTLKARLVGRRGPAPWQPFFDLRKLLGKTPVVSDTTSWIFRVTPYVLVSAMLVAALAAPVLTSRPPLAFAGI